MLEETANPAEARAPRKPKVNKRNVSLSGGKKIALYDRMHNPSEDSILVVGFERSVQEYSEIGASFPKNKNKNIK